MQPADLKSESFRAYPEQGRELAAAHLAVLRTLPLSFVVGLLREISEYDYKFPAERLSLEKELNFLGALPAGERQGLFDSFAAIVLPKQFSEFDWVNRPGPFLEKMSAYLWSSHQMEAYRKAAMEYGNRSQAAVAVPEPKLSRLGVAIIGQGVAGYDKLLFRNLRPHGTYFGMVKPENGLEQAVSFVSKRAEMTPVPYDHWYVDGGSAVACSNKLTCVQYPALWPMRTALLKYMQAKIAQPGMGPEELRSDLAVLKPGDLEISQTGDAVLDRFKLKLFTEGSGTQIFATSFAEWTAREALRRAQPATLLVRFAPRQQQRPMNELLTATDAGVKLDPVGSLVDGDMGAYYQWINQQRLPGATRSSFVVWFEGQGQALAIGPGLPRGAESKSVVSMGELLKIATS